MRFSGAEHADSAAVPGQTSYGTLEAPGTANMNTRTHPRTHARTISEKQTRAAKTDKQLLTVEIVGTKIIWFDAEGDVSTVCCTVCSAIHLQIP